MITTLPAISHSTTQTKTIVTKTAVTC